MPGADFLFRHRRALQRVLQIARNRRAHFVGREKSAFVERGFQPPIEIQIILARRGGASAHMNKIVGSARLCFFLRLIPFIADQQHRLREIERAKIRGSAEW